MLTISEVAAKFNISNRQVHDLVNFGYLNVANIYRKGKQGISFLFAENELEQLDVYSLLAEIQDKRKHKRPYNRFSSWEYKKLINVMEYYDRFMENIVDYPEENLLRISFYLFHLNHYAKSYKDINKELYALKNLVLKKLYSDYEAQITATYLIGPDRKKIFLCEDCKDAARSANMSYIDYVKKDYYCPKCYTHTVEKEYYSLIEFKVNATDYRFTFHLPLSSARRWMTGINHLAQGNRESSRYDDKMYLYGRRISRIEEKAFPLLMIKEKLYEYINS